VSDRSKTDPPKEGVHPLRRHEARKEISGRVCFLSDSRMIDGWALNISGGGLRAILEERVIEGEEFNIEIEHSLDVRRGRIIWVKEQPDGDIVGVEFLEKPIPSESSTFDGSRPPPFWDPDHMPPPSRAAGASTSPPPAPSPADSPVVTQKKTDKT
jgi:hypothetical protein